MSSVRFNSVRGFLETKRLNTTSLTVILRRPVDSVELTQVWGTSANACVLQLPFHESYHRLRKGPWSKQHGEQRFSVIPTWLIPSSYHFLGDALGITESSNQADVRQPCRKKVHM